MRDTIDLRGQVTLSIQDHGDPVEVREASNLVTTAGKAQLTAVLNWSAAQDQNAMLGGVLSPQNLYPIYGGLGAGTAPATVDDVILGSETGRAVIAEAASSGTQVIWTFFYPATSIDWTITEAGIYINGPAGIPSSSLNTGMLLNHAVFGAITKTSVQTATLQCVLTF